MDTCTRLRTLATMADGEQRGLIEALKFYCHDWLPAAGNPGIANREYTATRDPRWRKVSILVANILSRKPVEPEAILRLAELFEDSRNTASVGQTIPGRKVKTKKRWTASVIQEHCDLALKSPDPEEIKTYLFLDGKKLAKQIGCNSKTLAKTQFWIQRPDSQAKWRRENANGHPPKKRDTQ